MQSSYLNVSLQKEKAMDWNSMSDRTIISEIGKRLKENRLRKNLTQADLATKAGLNSLTIAKIEQGKPVSLLTLIAALRGLRLLDNLNLLAPEVQISPIEMLKLKGETRKRASKPKEQWIP